MHLISTLSYEQDTLQAKCGGRQSIPQTSTSEGPEPIKPKSKLKTKIGSTEEGDITIRGVITKIFVFKNKPRYSINELHKEKSGSKDLQHPTLIERASLGRSTPVYLGKYYFPFCVCFRFF